MILVIGGIKGGSGKTTLATNLAVMRSNAGKKVLLVDADEQRSASTFASQREASGISTSWFTIQLVGRSVHTQLMKFKSDFDDIIVDVGGRTTDSQESALLAADMFLIPFNPAAFDVWTLPDVRKLVSSKSISNEKLRSFALVNRADPKGADTEETISILNECEEFHTLSFTIGNRKTFRSATSEGLAVTEMKIQDKKAIQEIGQLYEYVYNWYI